MKEGLLKELEDKLEKAPEKAKEAIKEKIALIKGSKNIVK